MHPYFPQFPVKCINIAEKEREDPAVIRPRECFEAVSGIASFRLLDQLRAKDCVRASNFSDRMERGGSD